MEYRNKRVAVMGFGAEGKSAVDFMLAEKAKVSVVDEKSFDFAQDSKSSNQAIEQLRAKGVAFVFGQIPSLQNYDIIVRSPGVPLHHSRLSEINPRKTTITSVTKIFFDRCPCPIIGVTGTKGKGTTATLIYEMLITGGRDAYLGGNIGLPPLTFLPKLTQFSWVVLELSSFQLADLTKSPHIAVVLMVTNEHQDYHRGQDDYREAKASIIKFQQGNDVAVICADYEQSRLIGQHAKGKTYWYSRKRIKDVRDTVSGCYIDNNMVVWHDGKKEEPLLSVADIQLPGKHNWENVCAAVSVAKILGVSIRAMRETVRQFSGLAHRLQLVGEVDMVKYYDDSFSTTPETTMAAIDAFDQPKILILGGSGKNSDFHELARIIRTTHGIRAIIGIGEEWQRIKQELLSDPHYQMRIIRYDNEYAVQPPTTVKAHGKTVMEGCRTMQEIVDAARMLSQPGDLVLLSPACASFGMFKNYKDRGEQFIKEVSDLTSSLRGTK